MYETPSITVMRMRGEPVAHVLSTWTGTREMFAVECGDGHVTIFTLRQDVFPGAPNDRPIRVQAVHQVTVMGP